MHADVDHDLVVHTLGSSGNPASSLGRLGGTTGPLGSQQTSTPFQFQMGGNQPSAQTNTLMFSAGQQQLGAVAPSQQLQQPTAPPAFQFGQSAVAPGAASTSSASQGYNFSMGSGPNLNFGSQAAPAAFSASNNSTASAAELKGRVIKRATRRKKV